MCHRFHMRVLTTPHTGAHVRCAGVARTTSRPCPPEALDLPGLASVGRESGLEDEQTTLHVRQQLAVFGTGVLQELRVVIVCER